MINQCLKINAIKFNHKELKGILENHNIFDKEYIQLIAKLMVKKIREIKAIIKRNEMMEKAGLPVHFIDYDKI